MKKVRLVLMIINLIIFGIWIREFLLYNELNGKNKNLVDLNNKYNNLLKDIENYDKLMKEYDLINSNNISLEKKRDDLKSEIANRNVEIVEYNKRIDSLNSAISKMS